MTRTVWMGAGLSVAVIAAATMPRCWRLPVLGGALLAAVLVVGTHWDNLVAFKRDRDFTARETANSVYVRPVLAVVAWNMFLDHPLFGCGFDQYSRRHQDYLADRSTQYVLEYARGNMPHNVLMAVLTETGLVGLGLFLLLLALWSRDAWRLWNASSPPLPEGEGRRRSGCGSRASCSWPRWRPTSQRGFPSRGLHPHEQHAAVLPGRGYGRMAVSRA